MLDLGGIWGFEVKRRVGVRVRGGRRYSKIGELGFGLGYVGILCVTHVCLYIGNGLGYF